MSIGSRIKERRESLGLTQVQLAELLGVTKGAIGNYETDANSPKASMLYKVFDVLQCDANYLFQDEIRERREHTASPWEMEHLVKKYRALDLYGQVAVTTLLDQEHKRCIEQASEKAKMESSAEKAGSGTNLDKTIPFRRSYQPASAGTGMYLGPDEFETIYVQENDLTRRASFGVPVSGDSMEPSYHDGDVLLVERAEDIKIGEIGVFTINGEGYVKERGKKELISLNPSYDPIQMNESILCSGRVIGILEPDWIIENK